MSNYIFACVGRCRCARGVSPCRRMCGGKRETERILRVTTTAAAASSTSSSSPTKFAKIFFA